MVKEKNNQKKGYYEESYIASLLSIVSNDVQENVQMKDVEYLQIVASSCEKFNDEFSEDTFDNRRIDSDN